MSDMQKSPVTSSHNFVARQSRLGNCKFSSCKQSPNKHVF